jgi:hypothetical protein
MEEVPEFAEKGTKLVAQISWRRILNKSAVEYNSSITFQGGTELSGKALIGWNSEDEEIVTGGMNSDGAINLGSVTPDKAAKSLTVTSKGINGKGEETSFKGVVRKTGNDTLTWQVLERKGGIAEGPSGVYTFKRVKRAKKSAE